MSISASVRQCLARFKDLEEKHAQRSDLEDEHGRFRIWAGNVSAHRTGGRRSLEYRLRDSSNLQSMVVALLQDLLHALEDLQNVLKGGARSLLDASSETSQVGQEPADEDSDDEDDAALFGVLQQNDPNRDPATRVVEEIREINLCLLRFSMTLRNPARHDQMKESASTSTHHFERFDIDHVRDKFPTADAFLHERLGKGISKHRQYFKYREDHHLKLTEGLDDEEVKHERPSTVATSLNMPVPEAPMPQGDELETESLYTATSYAQTTAGDSPLRPPPMPEAGQDGSPFECPLCFGIIIAEDERVWRQHLYEDLPPYICTHTDCITANQRYSRRRDWQRHLASAHNRYWLCPFGCFARYDSEHTFQKHLIKKHGGDAATNQRLLESCAVASNEPTDLDCPLCQKQLPSSKLWMKHLGHHLEQLALHAIPKHVFTLESEDESVDTDQSARSSKSSAAEDELDFRLTSIAEDEVEPISATPEGNESLKASLAAAQQGTGSVGKRLETEATGDSPQAATGAGGQGGTGNLDFLRNDRQFQQMKQVVLQQPQMLESMLQQMEAANPQLAELISQNPDEFLQLLDKDLHDREEDDVQQPFPPVLLAEEEWESIERLCRLGFERDQAIQAYFACDKNEELAANLLFDQAIGPEEASEYRPERGNIPSDDAHSQSATHKDIGAQVNYGEMDKFFPEESEAKKKDRRQRFEQNSFAGPAVSEGDVNQDINPQASRARTESDVGADNMPHQSASQNNVEAIANMEAMGFARDEIERCMRAAASNPDRALHYLLNGIPESHPTRTEEDTNTSTSLLLAPGITEESVKQIYESYQQMKADGIAESDPELIRMRNILQSTRQRSDALRQQQSQQESSQAAPATVRQTRGPYPSAGEVSSQSVDIQDSDLSLPTSSTRPLVHSCPVRGCSSTTAFSGIGSLKRHLATHGPDSGMVFEATEIRIPKHIVTREALVRCGLTVREDSEFYLLTSSVSQREESTAQRRLAGVMEAEDACTHVLQYGGICAHCGMDMMTSYNIQERTSSGEVNTAKDIPDGQTNAQQRQPQQSEDQSGEVDSGDTRAMGQLRLIEGNLNKYKDDCQRFIRDRVALDPTDCEDIHRNLSDRGLEEILVPLDEVETSGDAEARAVRKGLVAECQRVLRQLDEKKRSQHESVARNSPRESSTPPELEDALREPAAKSPDDLQPAGSDIPPGARWTKIDRKMVNPEALDEAGERFEERLDCVIVLRVLDKAEIDKLANRTKEIREERFARTRVQEGESKEDVEERHSTEEEYRTASNDGAETGLKDLHNPEYRTDDDIRAEIEKLEEERRALRRERDAQEQGERLGSTVKESSWPKDSSRVTKYRMERAPTMPFGTSNIDYTSDREENVMSAASREEKTTAERERAEGEWQAFLAEQKAKEEKEKVDKKRAEEELQNELRKRLEGLGYTEAQIAIMVREESEKVAAASSSRSQSERLARLRGTIYPKIHVKYLSIDTLRYYELPWEYDSNDSNYIIIKQDLDKYETEVLFEHTRTLRANDPEILLEPKDVKEEPTSSRNKDHMRYWFRSVGISDLRDGRDGMDNSPVCFCQRAPSGKMIGCDNDDCDYQWFHYGCVGLKSHPQGEWLCPVCRKLPRDNI